MTRRKRPPLAPKRADYVDSRASGRLVGKPLHYPAGVADRYRKAIDRLIAPMIKEYEREIRALWNDTSLITMDASLASQSRIQLNKLRATFEKMFRDRAPEIVEGVLNGVDKYSAFSLTSSLKDLSGGLTIKAGFIPAALKESITAATAENVALIKSIASQYHERIEGAVMRSIQQGGEGRKTIFEEIRNIDGMTKRRAKFIAEDQTRKATEAANTERAKSLGIRKGKWVHSGGGVDKRQKHVDFDGKIFDLNDPPAIGDKGQKVMPGTEPGCKCFWTPVLEWGGEEE